MGADKLKDTTNPFKEGVSYDEFLSNVKGKETVDSLLKKADCTVEQIKWIKEELTNHNKNNK
tara:strand:+ start:1587 stop:1772 length:186 start_codon:yes stop_codon:yes gene_type:complete